MYKALETDKDVGCGRSVASPRPWEKPAEGKVICHARRPVIENIFRASLNLTLKPRTPESLEDPPPAFFLFS